jgi:hypothetical protein
MPVRTKRPLPQEPRITGLRVDYELVYEAIDRERRRRNMKFYEVAAILGLRPTLTGWGHGGSFSTTHLARALAWLDRPLSDFTTTEVQPRPVAEDDAA